METPISRRWHQDDHDKRRAAGICLSCSQQTGTNARTGKPYARCSRHRKMAAEASTRYFVAARLRWRKLGCCVACGTPCAINPQTKKAFRNCIDHRLREAALHHASRLKQEAHGSRILAVLPFGQTMTTQDVRKAARMDTSACSHTLRQLVEAGVLDQQVIKSGKQGASAIFYSRAKLNKTEA